MSEPQPTLEYAHGITARRGPWSLVRRRARQAVLVCTLLLLHCILPPYGNSTVEQSEWSLALLQDDEFGRWQDNELARRSHIIRQLPGPGPALVKRKVPPLSAYLRSRLFAIYTAMVLIALICASMALAIDSLSPCRFAWWLICLSALYLLTVLLIYGWPVVFFDLFYPIALNLFFAVYAFEVTRLLKVANV